MSSTAAPFGLRPAFAPSGTLRPGPLATIQTGYATAIFQYSPVVIDANGFLTASAAGADAMGTFLGVEYTDTLGARRYSNQWVASTAGTDIRAYYTLDQSGIVYEIQANATLTIAAIGQQYDWSALAGSTVTGLSSVSLNVASAAANAGLRVIGLTPGPDNDWGDAFPIVQVQISEHAYVADVASI